MNHSRLAIGWTALLLTVACSDAGPTAVWTSRSPAETAGSSNAALAALKVDQANESGFTFPLGINATGGIAQGFTPTEDRVDAVDLFLTGSGTNPARSLTVRIRSGTFDGDILGETSVSIPAGLTGTLDNPTVVQAVFAPAITLTPGYLYYIQVDPDGGFFGAAAADPGAYPGGAAYQGGSTRPGLDIGFRTYFGEDQPPAEQTIAFTSSPPSPAYVGGTYDVAATATSGLPVSFSSLTPAICGATGGTVSLLAIGSCTVAADQAGDAAHAPAPQATQTFAVVWPFTGFFAPVDNLPTVNVAKAGRAIPLKFALGGDRGLAVLAVGSPASQDVACQSVAPSDAVERTETADGSSLSYDAVTGQYTYVWKTDRAWTGTCRRLTLTLADGTEHRANFDFTR